jgi:hypothetical protein
MTRPRLQWSAALWIVITAVGCHTDMYDQPKIEPLEESTFFVGGMGARPIPAGTVYRGQDIGHPAYSAGRESGVFVEDFPLELNRKLLERGRERFDIFCANCHGRTGEGDGMIVQRGYQRPPSFHSEKLRGVPLGYLFHIVSNGKDNMPAYSRQIPVADRWAVVAYLRVLQLSRHFPGDDLTPAERLEIDSGAVP